MLTRLTGWIIAAVLLPGICSAAEHVWVFAGQSNMAGEKGLYESALRPVVEKAGHRFTPLHLAWGGNKIENWLDPDEKDYARNWGTTEKAIKEAIDRGAVIAGVEWFQGESNVNRNPCDYQTQLTELIGQFREVSQNPKLPFLVVQLSAGTYAATGGDWSLGILREAQRRTAEADDHVSLIASTDCRLQDRVVHLARTDDGHGLVARRLTTAARKLVYGETDLGLGPQISSVHFGNSERTIVVATFKNVTGDLKLEEEALGQFFVSQKIRLPITLNEAPHPEEFGDQMADHMPPINFSILPGKPESSQREIAFRFQNAVPKSAVLSWTTTRHAALGRGRRWKIAFAKLTDDTMYQTPAFAALPIEPFKGETVSVAESSRLPKLVPHTRPIAVNLLLSPLGFLTRDEVAGAKDWRQSQWNPTARYTFPYLFDDQGQLTNVAIYSYIHFGKRGETESQTPDDRLRFSGQGQSAEFRNLQPNQKYDLALYTVVQGENPKAWANLNVSTLTPPKKPKAKPGEVLCWEHRIIGETSQADAHGWQVASQGNGWQGNVIIVSHVDSGPLGILRCSINAPPAKRAEFPNPAKRPYLCGLQIRPSANQADSGSATKR